MFEWLDERVKNAEENLERLKGYQKMIEEYVPWETLTLAEKTAFEERIHHDVNYTDKKWFVTMMDFIFEKNKFGKKA